MAASIQITPATVAPGGTLTVIASGLAPGEWIAGAFQIPPNPVVPIANAENGALHTANASGVAQWQWQILPNVPSGSYVVFFQEESGETQTQNLQIQGTAFAPFISDLSAPISVCHNCDFGVLVGVTNGGSMAGTATMRVAYRLAGNDTVLTTYDVTLVPNAVDTRNLGPFNASSLPAGQGQILVQALVGGTAVNESALSFEVQAGGGGTNPTVTLSPTSMNRGDTGTATFANFTPNDSILLTIHNNNSGVDVYGPILQNTDAQGNFILSLGPATPPADFNTNNFVAGVTYDFIGDDLATGVQARATLTVSQPQPGTPSITASPTSINPGDSLNLTMRDFGPVEQIRITDNGDALTFNSPPQTDSTGLAVATYITQTNIASGTHTLQATGLTSGKQASTTISVIGGPPPPPPPPGQAVITLEDLITPYFGKPLGIAGTVILAGQPLTPQQHAHIVVDKLTLGFPVPGVAPIVDTYIESNQFDSGGNFSTEVTLPAAESPLEQVTGRDARLTLTVLGKDSPPTNYGSATKDFHVNPQPVKFHISSSKSDPAQLQGTTGETFAIIAFFGAFGSSGAASYARVTTQKKNAATGNFEEIPSSVYTTDKALGGTDLDYQYRFDTTLDKAYTPGQALQYRVVVQSWENTTSTVISTDAEEVVSVQIGPKSVSQLFREWLPWILIAGGGAVGLGIVYKLLTRKQDEFSDIRELAKLQAYKALSG